MEFTAGDIAVRPWQETDLPLVAKWMSDPRVLKYFGGRDDASDEARVRESFAEDTPDHRCIFSLEGESIGYIQFCPMDRGEFGFPVHERVWGMATPLKTRPQPPCCVPEVQLASEAEYPAGFRSIALAAVPFQRTAWLVV